QNLISTSMNSVDINEKYYVKKKLEQSESQTSEPEAIVYDMSSDGYTENMSITFEEDPVDEPRDETLTKIIKGHKIRRTPKHEGMHPY
ncbi:hypothetical protein CHS0354_018007, partial [Potamilus streckersoni]